MDFYFVKITKSFYSPFLTFLYGKATCMRGMLQMGALQGEMLLLLGAQEGMQPAQQV